MWSLSAKGLLTPEVTSDQSALNKLLNDEAARLAWLPLIRQLWPLAFILLACWLAARFLDHRPFRDLGFHFSRAWWRDFVFGLVLGAVLMLAIFLAERAAGWITVTGVLSGPARGGSLATALIVAAAGYVLVAIYEELYARGYLLRNLAEGFRWRFISPRAALLLAYLLSSVVFGSLHQGNSNATLLTTPLLALAGLFLGLGYILTGELALSIGLHITWNFFQGYVFGFAVSGGSSGASLIAIQQGGPVAWTGGAWGPEGGIMGLLALLVGSLLIIAWIRVTRGVVRTADRLAVYERPAPASVSSGVSTPPATAAQPGRV
jgi:membrane protease YdiL (CAAX protease family)